MSSTEPLPHLLRQHFGLALMSACLALPAARAEVTPCVSAEGQAATAQKPCPKGDKAGKVPSPSSPQQYKAALRANAERPSEQDEPPERENRTAPEATQAPQRQQDLDTQMFRR